MSTEAQIAANKANAQQSRGPRTEAGKAIAALNNLRHGFTGEFRLLAWEEEAAYHQLVLSFFSEHKPEEFTEQVLVEKMAQHHWLTQRAIELQNRCFEAPDRPAHATERSLTLYMRYQTTHERAFHKCLNDLLKVRAEKRKAAIGFESQEQKRNAEARKQAEESRRQNNENRKGELHKFQVWLAEAKAEHQEVLTMNIETPETRIPNRFERVRARQQAA